jgi:hypothetical protein
MINLEDDLREAEEALAEIEAQHLSETAQFGDSWPGAQLEIAALRAEVNRLRALLSAKMTSARLKRQRSSAIPNDEDLPF